MDLSFGNPTSQEKIWMIVHHFSIHIVIPCNTNLCCKPVIPAWQLNTIWYLEDFHWFSHFQRIFPWISQFQGIFPNHLHFPAMECLKLAATGELEVGEHREGLVHHHLEVSNQRWYLVRIELTELHYYIISLYYITTYAIICMCVCV